jgi:hypothetical protein
MDTAMISVDALRFAQSNMQLVGVGDNGFPVSGGRSEADSFPGIAERIVENCPRINSGKTQRRSGMSKRFEIRTRNGKKGPGHVVVIVGTQKDADQVKATLETEKAAEMVFITEQEAPKVVTFTEWMESRKAEVAQAALAAEAIAKLTPEQLVAFKASLGIKEKADKAETVATEAVATKEEPELTPAELAAE